MVFSTQTILSSKNNSISIKENDNIIYKDHSFFLEAIEYILKDHKEFQTNMICSYSNNTINESGSDILKSALGKIEPKKILNKVLEKFIEILEKLWNKFKSFMINFFNKDRTINKYKKELETFENTIYFQNDRYIYTNLGMNTSYTTFKSNIEKEFSTLILKLSTFRDFKSYDQLYNELEIMKQDINSNNEYFENMRGNILGSRNSIKKEEFATELFNYYRNNGSYIPAGKISPQEVRTACKNYFNYNTLMKSVEKDKNDMLTESRKIQKEISKIKLENFVKVNISEDDQRVFVKILSDKSFKIKQVCDIYLQVFSAKLDAVKESNIQYTKILLEACKNIVKEGR